MNASKIATKAADLVGGDRQIQYGDKEENFGKIAALWNAWLEVRRDPAASLTSHDVAQMMVLTKLARTQSGTHNIDNYVDAAGYAACAGEVADALQNLL